MYTCGTIAQSYQPGDLVIPNRKNVMIKISRDWATPLTIGSFGLMAVTGILMFFHLDSGLNKTAHEWLGWLMVAGVAAHAVANWNAFKRHFVVGRMGQRILAVSALVIAGSFLSFSNGGREGGAPPALALKAVMKAPLSSVAPLSGKPVDQLIGELRSAGVQVAARIPLSIAWSQEIARCRARR